MSRIAALLVFPAFLALALAAWAGAAHAGPWPDAGALLQQCADLCADRASPQAEVGDCVAGCQRGRGAYANFLAHRGRPYSSRACGKAAGRVRQATVGPNPGLTMGGAFYADALKRMCP